MKSYTQKETLLPEEVMFIAEGMNVNGEWEEEEVVASSFEEALDLVLNHLNLVTIISPSTGTKYRMY